LVHEELYEEVLQLVVERRPAGIFPLLDRLMEAGVDLAEFIGGVADVFRGLLMLQVGAEPEGLTEALRATLQRYRDRLDAGDVLRMLRLLADNETGIRRSVSPRLVVETLLLRWAMMDRTVDLEQVIGAGRRGSGEAGKQDAGKRGGAEVGRQEATTGQDVQAPAPIAPKGSALRPEASKAQPSSPPLGPPRVPPAQGAPAPPPRLPASPALDAISAAWPAMVMAVKAHNRFLGEAFAATEPVELDLPLLTVVMREPNPLFAERLLQEAGKVEEVLTRSLGQPVRLRVTAAPAIQEASPSKPRRMSESSLNAERLREFRSKDPALDTAADALDLEIVD
jgi:DNA polymerase III subunit gamma/tau